MGSEKTTFPRCINFFKNADTGKLTIDQTHINLQNPPKKRVQLRALGLLIQVGSKNKNQFYPSQLSGSQQQRIGIAWAAALSPDLLLFDEPTSPLDLVDDVLGVIRQLEKGSQTMIIMTYEVADIVVFMTDGYIIERKTPVQIFNYSKEHRIRAVLSQLRIDYR